MYRDKETLSFELMSENYFADLRDYDDEPEVEPEEFERDYTPAELAAAQEKAWALDMKLLGYRYTTIVQPSELRRMEAATALVAAGASLKSEIAQINADAKRIREIRLEFAEELAALPALEDPHASDCAYWVEEPCNCVFGKPDHYFEQFAEVA